MEINPVIIKILKRATQLWPWFNYIILAHASLHIISAQRDQELIYLCSVLGVYISIWIWQIERKILGLNASNRLYQWLCLCSQTSWAAFQKPLKRKANVTYAMVMFVFSEIRSSCVGQNQRRTSAGTASWGFRSPVFRWKGLRVFRHNNTSYKLSRSLSFSDR